MTSPRGPTRNRPRRARFGWAPWLAGAAAACSLAAPDEGMLGGGLACPDGLADCNHDSADGCEIRPSRSRDHCGACGVVCGEQEVCHRGQCVPRCHGLTLTNGDARMPLASAGYAVGEGEFTIELWVRTPFARPQDELPSAFLWSSSDESLGEGVWVAAAARQLGCRIATSGRGAGAFDQQPMHTTWHHVACQRRAGRLESWLDGSLVTSAPSDARVGPSSAAALGRTAAQRALLVTGPDSAMRQVGPFRLSRVARYDDEFAPDWRWPVDPDTVSQYLVETGLDPRRLAACSTGDPCGDQLIDEAGGDNNGYEPEGITPLEVGLPCD